MTVSPSNICKACDRCRTLRIKCNGGYRCQRCQEAKIECVRSVLSRGQPSRLLKIRDTISSFHKALQMLETFAQSLPEENDIAGPKDSSSLPKDDPEMRILEFSGYMMVDRTGKLRKWCPTRPIRGEGRFFATQDVEQRWNNFMEHVKKRSKTTF